MKRPARYIPYPLEKLLISAPIVSMTQPMMMGHLRPYLSEKKGLSNHCQYLSVVFFWPTSHSYTIQKLPKDPMSSMATMIPSLPPVGLSKLVCHWFMIWDVFMSFLHHHMLLVSYTLPPCRRTRA